jgi:hypothetical protein
VSKDNLRNYNQPHLFDTERNKKEKPQKRTAAKKREVQDMLGKMKEESGCIDCSTKYPFYILDFDHVYGKKVANIGQMLDYFSIEDILKEVAKCDIVCSNCHRERTYQRKNSPQDIPHKS